MKSVFVLLLLVFSTSLMAQDSTFRYVRLRILERVSNNSISLDLDRGHDSTYQVLKDQTVLKTLLGVQRMSTIFDCLTYMEEHGWKVFQFVHPDYRTSSNNFYSIYFRRAFHRNELVAKDL
jgi:hypothetical protein